MPHGQHHLGQGGEVVGRQPRRHGQGLRVRGGAAALGRRPLRAGPEQALELLDGRRPASPVPDGGQDVGVPGAVQADPGVGPGRHHLPRPGLGVGGGGAALLQPGQEVQGQGLERGPALGLKGPDVLCLLSQFVAAETAGDRSGHDELEFELQGRSRSQGRTRPSNFF